MKNSPFNSQILEQMLQTFDVLEFMDFQKKITVECFTLKECGFSSRQYDYCKKLGLTLPPVNENTDTKRKWVRPSITEFIWLKTLETCRKLGLESDALLIIKTALFQKIDTGIFNSDQSGFALLKQMKPIIEKAKGVEAYQDILNYIKEHGADSITKMMNINFSLFELMLYTAVKTKCNVGFLSSDKIKFIPFYDNPLLNVKERLVIYEDFFKMNFTYINYWDFLQQIPNMEGAPKEVHGYITGNDFNEILKQEMNEYSKEVNGEIMVHKNRNHTVKKVETLSIKVAIEKTLYEFPFQDLEILMREGKKFAIKRTVYE